METSEEEILSGFNLDARTLKLRVNGAEVVQPSFFLPAVFGSTAISDFELTRKTAFFPLFQPCLCIVL